jgi:hypothetical protein
MGRLTRHRILVGAPLLVGAVAFAICGLRAALYGPRLPAIHDEFSYLLAADTFAHGRCANPTHPLWQHFETIHVLQQPSYASKYPPGQGLFLAAGQVLAGHPAVGVWFGLALACGAVTWMLRAFVPAGWAAVGGLLLAARLATTQWGWEYMGGGVAAAGGALFLGGWTRLRRKPRWSAALVMVAGVALMAITRPFEGLVFCLPAAAATIWWLFAANRSAKHVWFRQVLAPSFAVLLPAALALGYYNYRVTGNALRLPYAEYIARYTVAPVLLILPPYATPEYRHDEIRGFHTDFELSCYSLQHTPSIWLRSIRDKTRGWWSMFVGWGLTVPLLAALLALRGNPRTRFALLSGALVLGVVATLETWGEPHYVAPVVGVIVLAIIQGARLIALWPWAGRTIARWVVGVWLAGCLVAPAANLLPGWQEGNSLSAEARAALAQRLHRAGGRHLIIVRYLPGHSYHEELVYNSADIDNAPVVWAREMGPAGREQLLNYFSDRTIWLLEASGEGGSIQLLRGPVTGTMKQAPGAR